MQVHRTRLEELDLDRMAIEEAGPVPERLAEAIHRQLDYPTGRVPVVAIAFALDIHEIRIERLDNFEGALVMPLTRDRGSILVNDRSGRRRQRFTLAHELGHFLNVWHRPITDDGFWCTKDEIGGGPLRAMSGASRHRTQEVEANRFAVELLMPTRQVLGQAGDAVDLAAVVHVADHFDVSREAAARRYVDVHAECMAVVFSHEGRMRYAAPGREFPNLSLRPGDPLPLLPVASGKDQISGIDEGGIADWLRWPERQDLAVQTLHQQGGYAMTLLVLVDNGDAEEDDDGVEDAVDRFGRFGR